MFYNDGMFGSEELNTLTGQIGRAWYWVTIRLRIRKPDGMYVSDDDFPRYASFDDILEWMNKEGIKDRKDKLDPIVLEFKLSVFPPDQRKKYYKKNLPYYPEIHLWDQQLNLNTLTLSSKEVIVANANLRTLLPWMDK